MQIQPKALEGHFNEWAHEQITEEPPAFEWDGPSPCHLPTLQQAAAAGPDEAC